jgi:hypothetical protein
MVKIIMLKRIFKKPKLSKQDFDKINSTITGIKECSFCNNQKDEIKKCMELHGVKNNLKSVTWHNLKCEDCRARVMLIANCKKRGHIDYVFNGD